MGFSVGNATDSILSSRGFYTHFRENSDGILEYKSQRAYDQILIHEAKRLGFQLAEHYANMATEIAANYAERGLDRIFGYRKIKKALKKIEKDSQLRQTELRDARKKAEDIRNKQSTNFQKIIEAGKNVDSGLGIIKTSDNQTIEAVDCCGNKVVEALMLFYDTDTEMTVEQVINQTSSKTIKTKTLCFYDVNAQLSQSTSKNLVLTKVQGRDFTRKELVSGGDITFNVNGMVNSNMPDVYPENMVKKLIQLSQYNGVVKINHILAKQFGVSQVIVKDFALGAQQFKNEQPYTMTLVAVEPDEDVIVNKDTVTLLNDILAESGLDGWYEALLKRKKEEIQSNGNLPERSKWKMWLANNI